MSERRLGRADISSYIRRNIAWIIMIYLIFAAFWGSWIVRSLITFDEEGLFFPSDAEEWYNQWFRLGRWAIVYLKKILGVYSVNPYFSNAMLFIFFPMSALLWCFDIETWAGEKTLPVKLSFVLIFTLHPVWALMFSYRMHMDVLVVGMVLLPLAMMFLTEWLEDNSTGSLIAALILTVICFGSFQTFMILFADAVAVYIFIRLSEETCRKKLMKDIMWIGGFTAVSVFIWYLIARVCCKITGNPYGDSYSDGQFMWGDRSFKESVKTILKYMRYSMFGDGKIYSRLYGIAAVIFIVILLSGIILRKRNSILSLIAGGAVILIPYALEIITAGNIVVRSQWAFVFSLSFIIMYELLFIEDLISRSSVRINREIPVIALVVIIVLSQGQIMTRLLYTDNHTMEVDLRTFQSIYDRALLEGASFGDAICFVGDESRHRDLISNSLVEYEVVGFSYMEYCHTAYMDGVDNTKVPRAMRAYGFNVAEPTSEQLERASQFAEDMPYWPSDGSVKVLPDEGVIIVKIGEQK